MKPVIASITVPHPREEVYDFLDVLGNHQAFTDHFLIDWKLSGPRAGVGAQARMRVRKPGPEDWLDLKVVAAERPQKTVEESVGAKGRRRTRGTYLLEELPGDRTKVSFELVWLEAPLVERLGAPFTRAVTRRANAKALRRLVDLLALPGGNGAIGERLFGAAPGPEPKKRKHAAPQQTFERTLRRLLEDDVDGYAALFAPDGVIEFPFAPAGMPRRIEGREEIRRTLAPLWERARASGRRATGYTVNALHESVDGETFVVEFDLQGEGEATGKPYRTSYVHIYQVRDNEIVSLRDYWNPQALASLPKALSIRPSQPAGTGHFEGAVS